MKNLKPTLIALMLLILTTAVQASVVSFKKDSDGITCTLDNQGSERRIHRNAERPYLTYCLGYSENEIGVEPAKLADTVQYSGKEVKLKK